MYKYSIMLTSGEYVVCESGIADIKEFAKHILLKQPIVEQSDLIVYGKVIFNRNHIVKIKKLNSQKRNPMETV